VENDIVSKQAQEDSVDLACTFRQAYKNAKFWKVALWGGSFFLAIIQIFVATKPEYLIEYLPSDLTVVIVGLSILLMLLSVFGQRMKMSKAQNLGNAAQQAHDYEVLNLGVRPSMLLLPRSLTKRYAKAYKASHPADIDNLKSWWPKGIGELPWAAGVAICQFSAFRWEAELRGAYLKLLCGILISTLLAMLIVAHEYSYTVGEIIINLFTPSLAFAALLLDELLVSYQFHRATVKAAENAENVWGNLLETKLNDPVSVATFESAQSAWQTYRSTSTPIFDWLYWLARKNMEENMLVDADYLVSQYKLKHSRC